MTISLSWLVLSWHVTWKLSPIVACFLSYTPVTGEFYTLSTIQGGWVANLSNCFGTHWNKLDFLQVDLLDYDQIRTRARQFKIFTSVLSVTTSQHSFCFSVKQVTKHYCLGWKYLVSPSSMGSLSLEGLNSENVKTIRHPVKSIVYNLGKNGDK